MKAHLAGIVARRAAATLHITPVTSSPSTSFSPPPLPHSTSLHHLPVNHLSPRQSLGVGLSSSPLSHTLSVPSMGPVAQTTRPASISVSPSPPLHSSPMLAYPEAPSLPIPPLPGNPEEELIQCTFILYIMLDAVHNKMRDDDLVLRQLYSILPELYLFYLSTPTPLAHGCSVVHNYAHPLMFYISL